MSSPGAMESAVPPTTPANPARPAPRANTTAKTSCTLTPEAESMSRSLTPARIIIPMRVRLRKSQRATPIPTATASTDSR